MIIFRNWWIKLLVPFYAFIKCNDFQACAHFHKMKDRDVSFDCLYLNRLTLLSIFICL